MAADIAAWAVLKDDTLLKYVRGDGAKKSKNKDMQYNKEQKRQN
jgi:hypothetical protein